MTLIHEAVNAVIKAGKPVTSAEVVRALGSKGPSTSAALWTAVSRGWLTPSHTASTAANPARFTANIKDPSVIPDSPWAGSRKRRVVRHAPRGSHAPAPSPTVGAKLRITIVVNGQELELTLAEANKIHSDLTAILDVSTHP